MAIQFARMEPVSRSNGKNACCKSAYNAKAKVFCERTSRLYNFTRDQKNNLWHTILLPEHVDAKFSSVEVLSNEVEHTETRCNSQLYKEYVLALPDNQEISLEDKKELILRFIAAKQFIQAGLGVQADIHTPNEYERNSHAHLLVTTRRFTPDGKQLGEKARDQNPDIRRNKGKAYIAAGKDDLGLLWKEIQNSYFIEKGLDIRVDQLHEIAQEHLGPVRMRGLLNQKVQDHITLHPHTMDTLYQQATSWDEKRKAADHDPITSTEQLFHLLFSQRAVVNKSLLLDEAKRHHLMVDHQWIRQQEQQGRIMKLFNQDDSAIGWTTPTIRKAEQRAVRFADRIHQSDIGKASVEKRRQAVKMLLDQKKVTLHQAIALEYLAGAPLNDCYSSIRVVQGIAGSGKSHVLGRLFDISQPHYRNIIGLAPTHRAKEELIHQGYATVETLKHFLFTHRQLNHQAHRILALKGSLFVLDEAGMVDTDSLVELLKIVWITQSELVLSGDDRQLHAMEPGGLFSYLKERYGSAQLTEIRRQVSHWGKEVAHHFSKGNASSGLAVLQQQDKHHHQGYEQTHKELQQLIASAHSPFLTEMANKSKISPLLHSMCHLISDWSTSAIPFSKKLILAVSNKQVDALNRAARTLLKEQGKLTGEEYSVSHAFQQANFSEGDRIVLTQSLPKKGIISGAFGQLLSVSATEFTAQMDGGQTLSFHPKEVSFKHGYASTVYKAQGASIDEVFVFHGGFSTTRNSYVKMSRHVKNIRFYSNAETSQNLKQLTKQLLRPDDRSASITYRTAKESEKRAHTFQGLRKRCYAWLSQKKVQFSDLVHNNAPYYQLDAKAHPEVTVKKTSTPSSPLVTLQTEDSQAEIIPLFPDKKQNTQAASTRKTIPQALQNTKMDVLPESQASPVPSTQKINHHLHCQEDLQRLRQELKWGAERIACQLLGEPNTTLSNKAQLRFGNKGSFTVNISGEKAGLWHDFSTSEGGDLLKLIMQQQNIGFKQAVKEARSLLGQSSIETVFESQRLNTMVKAHHTGNKVKRIQHLFQSSLPSHTILQNYLSKGRGIEGDVPADIRFLPSFGHSETQTKLPVLMAFARNAQGEIQGGQAIYLDAELACKADIHPNKRSLGMIKGNFVEIQPASMGITLLEEGVETALSLKEAHIPGRILCSLGVGNFKNYTPQPNETVIFCADNDGNASHTEKAVAKAVTTLQKQDTSVFVVKPKEIGDFNDVLRHQGKEAVQQLILPELSKHIAPEWLSLWQQQQEQGWIKEDLLCSQDIAVVKQQIASRNTVLDQFFKDLNSRIL